MSVDDDDADHSIENELTHVIWAFGQMYPDYFHRPWSGIEAGTAQNDRFYQEDELKYHGTRDRGATSINFFGKTYHCYIQTKVYIKYSLSLYRSR